MSTKKTTYLFFILCATFLLSSCRPKDKIEQMRRLSNPEAIIWPDYANCIIPKNISPLNFYLIEPHNRYKFSIKEYDGKLAFETKGKDLIRIPRKKWKEILERNEGKDLYISLNWEYKGLEDSLCFSWTIRDSIDPYLVCRLIEPSYQTSSLIQTVEFNLTTAERRILFDNRLQDYGCVNCHTFAQNEADHIVYHVRFNRTGTFIVNEDSIIRVDLKSERFPQGGVYPSWHPNKRYIAFGTSSAYPFVHSKDIVRRTEVYDSLGDIILYDILQNQIIYDPRMADDKHEETFPCWSWDGKYLYFCQSKNPEREEDEDDVDFSKKIKYSLMRAEFDTDSGTFGDIDTIISAERTGETVSFPRISPDGQFLVFCLSDHGTFPIRHPESDLYILYLNREKVSDTLTIENNGKHFPYKKMENINSNRTESYHTWSSNGRWLLFSSKREDGLYARPYFTYMDSCGNSHKPFIMPMKDPAFYLDMLQSFNVPELVKSAAHINAEKAQEMSLYPTKKARYKRASN